MPEGQVIGRVSVKVLPDTDEFRIKAEAELEKIEDKLEVKVRATIDATGLKRDILQKVRQLNKDLKRNDAYKIRLNADIDGLKDFKIEAEVDEGALREVHRELERWKERNEPLKIRVTPHMTLGAGAFVEKRLDYLTRPRAVPIFPVLNNTAFNAVATALARLSGARLLDTTFGKITKQLKNLDKNLPIIGSIALAVAGLAGWSLTAASNLAALSYTLAQIFSVSLALPGIFGGMAIGIGATFAVFKDFNEVIPEIADELSALQDAMSDRFWSQAEEPIRGLIGTLFPQFKQGLLNTSDSLAVYFSGLADGLRGSLNGALDGMFQDLNDSIEVAAGGTDALANIIKVLGEVGAGYLPRLAEWFVDMGDTFSKWLDDASADGRLQGWIDAGIEALKDLARAFGSIFDIFAGIGRAAAEAGGSTIAIFADTLESIAEVVNSPSFQKALTGVFEAAHEAMSLIAEYSGPQVKEFFETLGKLLERVLPIVGEGIGKALGAITEALSQPVVSDAIVTFFEGLLGAIEALAPAMGPLAEGLAAIVEALGPVAVVFAELLAAALVPLADAIKILAPALVPLVELLGGALAQAIEILAPYLVLLVEEFAKLIEGGLLEGLESIITPLLDLFAELGPVLLEMAQIILPALGEFLPIIGEIFGAMLEALTPLIPVIGELISELLPVMLDWAKEMLPILSELVLAVLVPLIDMLAPLIEEYAPLLAEVLAKGADASIRLAEALLELAEEVMPILLPILEFLVKGAGSALLLLIEGLALKVEDFTAWIDRLTDSFRAWGDLLSGSGETWGQIWEDIQTRVGDAVQNIRDFIDRLVENVTGAWNRFWEGLNINVGEAWENIKEAVSGGADDVVQWIKELPARIGRAVTGFGSVLWNAGVQLIQGFINGIGSMFDNVRNILGDLTSRLFSWKGPPAKDKVLLYDAGRLVIGGFIDGLESQYENVRQSLQGLTREISGVELDIDTSGAELHDSRTSAALAAAVEANIDPEGPNVKVLNYYAAPNQSLSAEEELFGAANRSRMVDWG